MKTILLTFFLSLLFLINPGGVNAQCIPGDETTCPDPENNGEFCPETLPEAIFEEAYSQDFTILPPPEYVVDSAAGIVVTLHHITLKNVTNLPPGLSWESNSEDSVFLVGTYYCVLLEGTPTEKGFFPLHIEVDVYVPGIFGSPPIFVGTVVDSTTLAMTVADPSGVGDYTPDFSDLRISPNPFFNTVDIHFKHTNSQEVVFEVFDLLGNRVYSASKRSGSGQNKISFDGSELKPGMYLFTLRDSQNTYTSRIIKSY